MVQRETHRVIPDMKGTPLTLSHHDSLARYNLVDWQITMALDELQDLFRTPHA